MCFCLLYTHLTILSQSLTVTFLHNGFSKLTKVTLVSWRHSYIAVVHWLLHQLPAFHINVATYEHGVQPCQSTDYCQSLCKQSSGQSGRVQWSQIYFGKSENSVTSALDDHVREASFEHYLNFMSRVKIQPWVGLCNMCRGWRICRTTWLFFTKQNQNLWERKFEGSSGPSSKESSTNRTTRTPSSKEKTHQPTTTTETVCNRQDRLVLLLHPPLNMDGFLSPDEEHLGGDIDMLFGYKIQI